MSEEQSHEHNSSHEGPVPRQEEEVEDVVQHHQKDIVEGSGVGEGTSSSILDGGSAVIVAGRTEGGRGRRKGIDEDAMFDSLFGEESSEEGGGAGRTTAPPLGAAGSTGGGGTGASGTTTIEGTETAPKTSRKRKRKERSPSTTTPTTTTTEDEPVAESFPAVVEDTQDDEQAVEEQELFGIDPEKSMEDKEREYEREFANDVINPMKMNRTRKKSNVKIQADEGLVQSFVEKMRTAHAEDEESLEKNTPGFAKVKLLSEVQAFFQKQYVRESLFTEKNDGDGGVLTKGGVSVLVQCREWLTPLPDGSLPNLKIRDGLLKSLEKLELGEYLLRRSGVGKAVMLLSKHKSETLQNKKICRQLIQKWSRPIFAISSAYTQLEAFETEAFEQRKQSGRKLKRSSSSNSNKGFDEFFDSPNTEEVATPRYTARPPKVRMDYVFRPNLWPEPEKSKDNSPDKLNKSLKIHEKIQLLKTSKQSKSRAIAVGVNKLSK